MMTHKITRPKNSLFENSVLISDDGEKYVLLPGKARDIVPGTDAGAGFWARVKKVRTSNNEIKAVKIYTRQDGKPEFVEIAEKEYEILKRLNRDPVIIKLPNKQKVYLIQPFVQGFLFAKHCKNLRDALNVSFATNDLKLTIDCCTKFIEMLIKITLALQNFHLNTQYMHNDLSPYNVIYDVDADVTELIDFSESILLSRDAIEKQTQIFHDFEELVSAVFIEKGIDIVCGGYCLDNLPSGCKEQLQKLIDFLKIFISRKPEREDNLPHMLLSFFEDTMHNLNQQRKSCANLLC